MYVCMYVCMYVYMYVYMYVRHTYITFPNKMWIYIVHMWQAVTDRKQTLEHLKKLMQKFCTQKNSCAPNLGPSIVVAMSYRVIKVAG